MKRIVLIGIGVAIFILAIVASTWLSGQREEPVKVEAKESVKYVSTTPVKYNKVETSIISYGRVSSSQPLTLIAEVAGKIGNGNVRLKAGQNFKRGTLLAYIHDEEAILNLRAQKSVFLKEVAAILPDFKIDFEDSFQEWSDYFNQLEVEKPLPSLPQVNSSKQKTYLATKNIYTSYYNIKRLESNLAKRQLIAPFTGTIIEVILQTGSFTNVGGQIAKIVDTENLELKIPVSPDDVKWVNVGYRVNVESEDGLQRWVGKVKRIGEIVNPTTQSLDVFIDILPGEQKIYDGLYLRAIIPGKTVESAMEIPRAAVFDGTQVYVLQDSILKVKNIEVLKVGEETVLFSGLAENEQIVDEPLVNAYNNMKAQKIQN